MSAHIFENVMRRNVSPARPLFFFQRSGTVLAAVLAVALLAVPFAVRAEDREVRKQYYPDGSVMVEAEFLGGRKDGKFTLYHADGSVDEIRTYRHDVQHGTTLRYYADGAWEAVPYSNGVRQGVARSYFPDGTLWMEKNFYNNALTGTLTEYAKNGSAVARCACTADNDTCRCSSYYATGKLRERYALQGGVRQGRATTYYPGGSTKHRDDYANGRLLRRKSFSIHGRLEFDRRY